MTDIDWKWFVGSSEDDDEMAVAYSREEAIAFGKNMMDGDAFYIVEACFSKKHARQLDNGLRETAPFKCVRNAEWINYDL